MKREEAQARYEYIEKGCNSLGDLSKNMKDFISWVFDESEEELKKLKQSLKNGRARYEANAMSLRDCSEMTTQKELKIRELKKQHDELDYKFSCVLDNVTGGCISKPRTDKALIDEAIHRQTMKQWEHAVKDYKENKEKC